MKPCRSCGAQIEENTKICPVCKENLNKKKSNKSMPTLSKVFFIIAIILVIVTFVGALFFDDYCGAWLCPSNSLLFIFMMYIAISLNIVLAVVCFIARCVSNSIKTYARVKATDEKGNIDLNVQTKSIKKKCITNIIIGIVIELFAISNCLIDMTIQYVLVSFLSYAFIIASLLTYFKNKYERDSIIYLFSLIFIFALYTALHFGVCYYILRIMHIID